jgi:UDP-N-acetylmuramoyl-tripeptide--D-alanyl-D-alanine ligase
LKTQASYNNEIGYPLTLLRLDAEHRYAVLEMGAERVGELRWLSETIASPDWSIVNTVGSAHLAHFGSLEQVAEAKSELVQVLSAQGVAFLNYDDPRVRAMAAKTVARVVTYGIGEGATVRALDITGDRITGCHFTLQYQDQRISIQLRLPGEHSITSALAAAAVGCLAGVPLTNIRDALEELTPVTGRGVIRPGPNGSRLIDDTYNAIRESVIAMARAMQATSLAPGGKRWAVLGELLEQGEREHEEHYAVGQALADKVDYLVVLGESARFFVEGAIQAGMPADRIDYFPARIADNVELEAAKRAVAELLFARVGRDDLLLVKGSRGVRMETLIARLDEEGK